MKRYFVTVKTFKEKALLLFIKQYLNKYISKLDKYVTEKNKAFTNLLSLIQYDIDVLEELRRKHYSSDIWFDHREYCLTASNFG